VANEAVEKVSSGRDGGRPRRVAPPSPEGRIANTKAYLRYVAARVATIAGDREQAIQWVRESLERRYFATPAWVRLGPSFKSLRGDKRFERMLAEAR
jgi:hypothetical protein